MLDGHIARNWGDSQGALQRRLLQQLTGRLGLESTEPGGPAGPLFAWSLSCQSSFLSSLFPHETHW